MEATLETVALYSLKLAYEVEGSSPILRDDPAMDRYQREVFGLLVRQADVGAIQFKLGECLGLACGALGGVMGRELQRLRAEVHSAQTLEALNAPLMELKGYLNDIL